MREAGGKESRRRTHPLPSFDALRRVWLPRVGLYTLMLWGIVTLNFFLPRAMPGDPILALVDPESGEALADVEIRTRLLKYYGLDKPLWYQYAVYLSRLVRGDLGWSVTFNSPVSEVLVKHIPWTLLLMVPSICLATLISLMAGAHAGWRRGTLTDRTLLVSFLLLDTIPVFLLGILLLMLFSVRLGWFPLGGAQTPFRVYADAWEHLKDVLWHVTLPMATLTLALGGRNFLLMRNSMVTVLGAEFMLVAQGKGLPERALLYRHGMRNAMLPVITRFAMQMGASLTGMILVETLFAYPGMGRLMFNAVTARDYPLLEGGFLLTALLVVFANLLADISYAWLDPRAREEPCPA